MGFGEWFAKYALDGIAAGIVGGAVTALAVWLTLRHERERHIKDETATEAARLQEHVANAFFAVCLARVDLAKDTSGGDWERARHDIGGTFMPPVIMAEAVARQTGDAALKRDLSAFREAAEQALESAPLVGPIALEFALGALYSRLTLWLESPETYGALSPIDVMGGPDESDQE